MPEISEKDPIKTGETRTRNPKWDSWVVEIPEQVVKAQDLPEGSIAILTVRDGKIEAEITSISDEMKSVSEQIFEEMRDVHEELKRLGD